MLFLILIAIVFLNIQIAKLSRLILTIDEQSMDFGFRLGMHNETVRDGEKSESSLTSPHSPIKKIDVVKG